MGISIVCEACGANVVATLTPGMLHGTTAASLLPQGWGITGIPDVTPTALLCQNCRTYVGGYTVSSFVKVNTRFTTSGSASAIAMVSATNLTGSYPV
jgi:hypothetical protein